jgi:hypothetical protein
VRFDDKQIPPGEEWYYEIDGRSHGPLSRTDLEELLSRSGETAAEVRIRQGADGPWTPFRSGSPTANTPRWQGSTSELGGPSADGAGQPGPQRSVAQAGRSGFHGFLHGHWDIVAAVGVWILLNVLFLLFWPQPYARERRYLAMLQGIVAEADQLRAKPASDREWQELGLRTQQTLAPIVRDLEKSANSSELVRQQLLWCARDLVPRIIGPQSKERNAQERRLKKYLESVASALARV